MGSKKSNKNKSKKKRCAPLKECPYCKGKHRLKSAYNACKRSHVVQKWGK